jgi:pyruvate/2-oxoglutarate dehydrogenase complex dihydrolipoamide dehydrogenase (E3) component
LTKTTSGVALTLEAGGKTETLEAERAIVAVGIEANVEGLGLEALGVKIDRGHVVIDADGATNVAGLYAIGDIAGPPWLAHKASHEAVACVEHIAGAGRAHPRLHLFDSPGRLHRRHRGPGQGEGAEDQGRPLPVPG